MNQKSIHTSSAGGTFIHTLQYLAKACLGEVLLEQIHVALRVLTFPARVWWWWWRRRRRCMTSRNERKKRRQTETKARKATLDTKTTQAKRGNSLENMRIRRLLLHGDKGTMRHTQHMPRVSSTNRQGAYVSPTTRSTLCCLQQRNLLYAPFLREVESGSS